MHRKKSRPAARTAPEFRRKTAPRPGGRGFFPAARRPGGPLPAGETRHTPPEYPARFPAVRPGWCTPAAAFPGFPSQRRAPAAAFPGFPPRRCARSAVFPGFPAPPCARVAGFSRLSAPAVCPSGGFSGLSAPPRRPGGGFSGLFGPVVCPEIHPFYGIFRLCRAADPPGGIRFSALIFGDRGPLS